MSHTHTILLAIFSDKRSLASYYVEINGFGAKFCGWVSFLVPRVGLTLPSLHPVLTAEGKGITPIYVCSLMPVHCKLCSYSAVRYYYK